jgi:hypothetical protein
VEFLLRRLNHWLQVPEVRGAGAHLGREHDLERGLAPGTGSRTAACVCLAWTSRPTKLIISDMVGTSHSWGVGRRTTLRPSPRTSMSGVPTSYNAKRTAPAKERRPIGSRKDLRMGPFPYLCDAAQIGPGVQFVVQCPVSTVLGSWGPGAARRPPQGPPRRSRRRPRRPRPQRLDRAGRPRGRRMPARRRCLRASHPRRCRALPSPEGAESR